VIQNGKEVDAKEIVVNDPLVHRGLRFYQASYGMTGNLDELKVMATPEGGSGREVTLRINEPVDLDPNTTVTLAEFIPDFFIRDNQIFKRSDNPENPAFRLQVRNKATGEEAKLWIFAAYNDNAQGQKTNYGFAFREMQMGYFTGLEVSHEPGQWLVWAGCILMGVGLFVAFYMVHMRIWIVAIPDAKGKLVLWIGGQANKNKDSFEQKFKEVVEGIRTELESVSSKTCSTQKEESDVTLVAVK
jgi:cytochrome c biogenesis protein